MSKETEKLLQDAFERIPEELVHDIAQSMASFIAAIDSDSARVSAYIERRLAPLLGMAAIDIRSRRALEHIRNDARPG